MTHLLSSPLLLHNVSMWQLPVAGGNQCGCRSRSFPVSCTTLDLTSQALGGEVPGARLHL